MPMLAEVAEAMQTKQLHVKSEMADFNNRRIIQALRNGTDAHAGKELDFKEVAGDPG
jgi:hypothetical protein